MPTLLVAAASLISGNSGVGKTSFLVYVIKRLLMLDNRPKIVYEDLSTDVWFVIPSSSGAAHADRYHRHTYACDVELDAHSWYLVDTGAKAKRFPTKTLAFTVVVASPHAAGHHSMRGWSKEQGSPPCYFMPCCWTADELELCRHLIAPTVAEKQVEPASLATAQALPSIEPDTVAERFRLYGGIARLAFATEAQLEELLDDLERAYQQCDFGKIADSSIYRSSVATRDQLLAVTLQCQSRHLQVEDGRLRQRQHHDVTSLAVRWSGERANSCSSLTLPRATQFGALQMVKIFENHLGHVLLRAGGDFSVQQFLPYQLQVRLQVQA